MSQPTSWTAVESTTLVDCSVFQVQRERVVGPGGAAPHDLFRIEAGDWVNVVPVTREGGIVLVRQYRAGSRTTTLEIPGGMVDPGETPADAAARELLEETGYGGGTIRPLGTVNPNPALFGNRCHTFLAEGVTRIADAPETEGEVTSVEVVAPEALEACVARGEIDHALVIAALFFHERRRRGLPPPGAGA